MNRELVITLTREIEAQSDESDADGSDGDDGGYSEENEGEEAGEHDEDGVYQNADGEIDCALDVGIGGS